MYKITKWNRENKYTLKIFLQAKMRRGLFIVLQGKNEFDESSKNLP